MSLDAVIELGQYLFITLDPPFQIKGWIAEHVVKEDTRLIQSDIPILDIGVRIQVTGDLIGFVINLTAIQIVFRRHIIEEVAHTAG